MGIRLLGFAAIGLVSACGRSDLLLDEGDGVALQDADVPGSDSAAAAPTGSSSNTAPGSAGAAPGNTVPPAATTTPGMTIPPGMIVAADAGCGPSILGYDPGQNFAPCWACVAKGCAPQLAACAADCSCNSAIAGALACVSTGSAPPSCFVPALSAANDPAVTEVGNCLLMTSGECSCGSDAVDAAPPPAAGDASSACVIMGGSAGSGDGQCTSTLQETCGGTQYQVVCACPQGSCACFGPSTQVISFDGCPYCPTPAVGEPVTATSDDLFTRCGFPH